MVWPHLDGRCQVAKALAQWRRELIQDLDGIEVIGAQQATLIEIAARTKLLLNSVDVWLLGQRSLVNGRKKAALPIVRERTQLADTPGRLMAQLGLQRRPNARTWRCSRRIAAHNGCHDSRSSGR